MSVELRIRGPGLDLVRALFEGQPPVVLGRDAECDVCLPDPQRNISRKHLALWLQGGEVHFHVLSVVNGVEMPFGEAPPGARGVLLPGQEARIGGHVLALAASVEDAPTLPIARASPGLVDDPWAVFDREPSGIAPVHPSLQTQATAPGSLAPPQVQEDDDPFGDWGFESTFGAGASGPALTANDATLAQDASAFFRGMGLDARQLGPLSEGELESMGRLVRLTIEALSEMQQLRTGVREDLHTEDRTQLAPRGRNPLQGDWSTEERLRYLFGGRMASVGLGDPEKMLGAWLRELLAHEQAAPAAMLLAVEGILGDLSPATLKTRLMGEGARLFEGSRLWEAYTRYHGEQSQERGAWARQLIEKHFAGAYQRELARIKRETTPRSN